MIVVLLLKRSHPSAQSEKLLYPDLTLVSERMIPEAAAVNEQQIKEKIQANKKFNNIINKKILENIMKLKLKNNFRS